MYYYQNFLSVDWCQAQIDGADQPNRVVVGPLYSGITDKCYARVERTTNDYSLVPQRCNLAMGSLATGWNPPLSNPLLFNPTDGALSK